MNFEVNINIVLSTLIIFKFEFFIKMLNNKINKSHYLYLIKLYVLLIFIFALLRISFIIYLSEQIVMFSWVALFKSIAIGVLFDSVVTSSFIVILVLLTFLLQFVLKEKTYKFLYYVTNIVLGIFLFTNIIDIFYFQQYGTRINSLVFEATHETGTIITTIWKTYPVIKVFLFFIVIYVIFYLIHKKIFATFNRHAELVSVSPNINKMAGQARHDDKQIRTDVKSAIINLLKWFSVSIFTFISLSFLYYGPPLWTIAEFSSSSVFNQASMNGVYCFIKSYHQKLIYNADLPSYNFFENNLAIKTLQNNIIHKNDSLTNKDFPFLRQIKQIEKDSFTNKNIVIIIMESFGSKYIGCLKNGIGYSPYFDSISKNGVLFSNFIANGPRTQNGVISTISGFPAILGINIQRRKGLNEFQTIGNILSSKGYITNFIHNGRATYDDIDKFMKQGGFVNQIDIKDFKTWRMKNEWGVSDEDLYEKAIKYIWNNNVPTLSVILTMTNHAPYDLPAEFIKNHLKINKMTKQQASFYYSDYALGKFIKECSKNNNYNNTVFYIMADHSENDELNNDELNMFRIPLLILNSKHNNAIIKKVASQCDIASTILSELNYCGNYHFIGQDVFAYDFKPFAFSRDYINNVYMYKDSAVLKYNLESNLFKNIVGSNNVKTENVDFLKCYIQTITYIFRNGKYRYDVK